MQIRKACQLLMLLSTVSMVIVLSFFAFSAEKNHDKKIDIFSYAIASYESILAGIENGNLQAESGNFFLTLYKWSVFLNDLLQEMASKNNNSFASDRNDGDKLTTHYDNVLSIKSNNKMRIQLIAVN